MLLTACTMLPRSCLRPQPAGTSIEQQQQQQLAGTKRPASSLQAPGPQGPAAAAAAGAAGAAQPDAAVPKGFFDDKAADNAARGIKA
jgi:hypothetical protein